MSNGMDGRRGRQRGWLFFVSNALEDSERDRRGITGDSPAASYKVFSLCQAVRSAGGRASVLSLGRGVQKGSWKLWGPRVVRVGPTPVVYAAHLDAPILTHFVSAISLALIAALRWRRAAAFIFYNPLAHYVPVLLLARAAGARCLLDLEDGVRRDEPGLGALAVRLLLPLYRRLCRHGAMVASTALREQAPPAPRCVCYGVAQGGRAEKDWERRPIEVLFCGGLDEDRGGLLLIDALGVLAERQPAVLRRLRFVVTGFGPLAGWFEAAAAGALSGCLRYFGRVSTARYAEVLRSAHLGLNLRLPGLSMGQTTFPSKVVEMTAHGLLLVSTRVGDVPLLFPDGAAVLLDEATPVALADALGQVAADPAAAGAAAKRGQRAVLEQLSPERVGRELLRLWTGREPEEAGDRLGEPKKGTADS